MTKPSSADIWAEMQRLRTILVERDALCGNCGCLREPERPHVGQGMGWCVIPEVVVDYGFGSHGQGESL